MPSARQQLRAMLQRGETIVAPGAYDPLSHALYSPWVSAPSTRGAT